MNIFITYADGITKINVSLPTFDGGWIFRFEHKTSEKWSEALLAEKITTKFHEHLEEIRRISYEQGWRDKANKKPKRTWFASNWISPKE